MKFKEFLKAFYVNVKDGILRFSIAFACTVLFFMTLSYEILFETNSGEVMIPLCMTYALVAVFSVLLKGIQEYLFSKLGSLIQYILCGIVGVVGFILTTIHYESLYMIMAYVGIMIALVCFLFFILMRGEHRDLAFPRLVTSLIFSGAICAVLSAGLSTCIAAVQFLIFTWNNIHKLYLLVNLFIWVVVFVNIFLSFIPKKDVPAPQSKLFRTIVLFAGLPLYMLLITILLVYLAKIVITWNMPVGEINWFASFASLFFIFFLLSVMQYSEKLAKLFVKFGGYFLVPVLVMQAIAVFERINAYGLTTPRTISLVLIAISILFIVGSIVIPKHLNKIAFLSGVIVLFVTITPWNVIDMPVASQTNILKTTLTANNMLKDGKVIPNPDVSEADAQKISSSYEYLKYNAKKLPDFIPDSDQTELELFGFTNNIREEWNYSYCNYETKDSVAITDYDKMISIYDDNNRLNFEHHGSAYDIDLIPIAKNLYAQYGNEKADLELYIVDENTALYFDNFNFNIENNEVSYCYFNGYVLLKD